jgi:Ca2+:H+ antiporter
MFTVHRDFSYISSRIFLTNPPGEDNALELHPAAPDALKEKERELVEAEPEVNSWACLGTIVITIGLMAVTAEFLVDSLEHVRESGNIREECVLGN